MQYLIITLLTLFVPDTKVINDSVTLKEIDIVASIKQTDANNNSYSSNIFDRKYIENKHIVSLKEFSSFAPNFYQPDYGSRMTSSIYVRGFGSRIDQPVIGMNIDGMPVMNKNNYDFDLFDISKIEIVRGAQSTLYGRNTSSGTININTLSPSNFQGKRFVAEYGTNNTIRLKASHYAAPSTKFAWSASVHYNHTDGFFTNVYNGKKCDKSDNFSTRLRGQLCLNDRWSIDNSLNLGYTDEGGYAYCFYDKENKELYPVNYNDPCSYRRTNIMDGLTIKYSSPNIVISSATGYSYTDDRMRMDNDFLPDDYFSLGQYQREHSITQEITAKSQNNKNFNWLGGVFVFYKHQKLSAPVLFKEQGINSLILENANKGLQNAFPDAELLFDSNRLQINDEFIIPTHGMALYGQIGYDIGRLNITAGIRFDYEYSSMDYHSFSHIKYSLSPVMNTFYPLDTDFKGETSVNATEIMPKLSMAYNFDFGNIYLSAAKGYKAGGFNTQLFSDILQNRMKNDLMNEFGVHLENGITYDDASATTYQPEENWNYEIGAHLSPFNSLNIDATLFLIECKNQQLTVFPEGMTTGRMMSNAGKSRSYGGEITLNYNYRRLAFCCSYGYAHATFRKYKSGNNDYSGNYLPLAPRETVSAGLSYRLPVPENFAKQLILNMEWSGTGRIYWNEKNDLSQAFYEIASASLNWEKGHWGASIWGKNLFNEKYKTFYFVSMQHPFFSLGKSRQIGMSMYFNL